MTTPLFKASDSVDFIERFPLTHMICYLHFGKYEQLVFIDILCISLVFVMSTWAEIPIEDKFYDQMEARRSIYICEK